MAAWLLGWNPDRSGLTDAGWAQVVAGVGAARVVTGDWNWAVNFRRVEVGDQAYLLRQGSRGRGLVAGAVVVEPVRTAPHWWRPGREAHYAGVQWVTTLPVDERIDVTTLRQQVPGVDWQHVYSSGGRVAGEDADRLDALLSAPDA